MKIVSFNFISDIEIWSDKKSSLFFNLAAAYSLFCEKGWIKFLICNYRLGFMAKIKNYSLSSDVNRSLGKKNKYNIYAVIQLKDMEYICENKSLRELGLLSLEKRKLWGIPDKFTNTWWEVPRPLLLSFSSWLLGHHLSLWVHGYLTNNKGLLISFSGHPEEQNCNHVHDSYKRSRIIFCRDRQIGR